MNKCERYFFWVFSIYFFSVKWQKCWNNKLREFAIENWLNRSRDTLCKNKLLEFTTKTKKNVGSPLNFSRKTLFFLYYFHTFFFLFSSPLLPRLVLALSEQRREETSDSLVFVCMVELELSLPCCWVGGALDFFSVRPKRAMVWRLFSVDFFTCFSTHKTIFRDHRSTQTPISLEIRTSQHSTLERDSLVHAKMREKITSIVVVVDKVQLTGKLNGKFSTMHIVLLF